MRYFNTSGPCNPNEHYTVMREALIERGREKVHQGRYFTIFAPRQAGKTTYFQLLMTRLRKEGRYTPIWISFENLTLSTREEFYDDVAMQLEEELSEYGLALHSSIHNALELSAFFKKIREQLPSLALFIDEFEGIPECVLSELMHTFRKMYHRKQHHALHSVALVGVSSLAEIVVSSASPFNIVDELQIPYFTQEELTDLIQQHHTETGQEFDASVVAAIYENTKGQPGLVNGLCAYLTEQIAHDRDTTVTLKDFYPTLHYFIKERRDKNMLNIVQKAREKREFMLRVLFSETLIEFVIDDPNIDYLHAHGVIDNVGGYVGISVPLYQKRLINAFRPLINGEADYYVSAHDTFQEYVTPTGLNLRAILAKYREYVRRRGFRAFDTEHLKEGAWHYSLDGFLNFFSTSLKVIRLWKCLPDADGRIF